LSDKSDGINGITGRVDGCNQQRVRYGGNGWGRPSRGGEKSAARCSTRTFFSEAAVVGFSAPGSRGAQGLSPPSRALDARGFYPEPSRQVVRLRKGHSCCSVGYRQGKGKKSGPIGRPRRHPVRGRDWPRRTRAPERKKKFMRRIFWRKIAEKMSLGGRWDENANWPNSKRVRRDLSKESVRTDSRPGVLANWETGGSVGGPTGCWKVPRRRGIAGSFFCHPATMTGDYDCAKAVWPQGWSSGATRSKGIMGVGIFVPPLDDVVHLPLLPIEMGPLGDAASAYSSTGFPRGPLRHKAGRPPCRGKLGQPGKKKKIH